MGLTKKFFDQKEIYLGIFGNSSLDCLRNNEAYCEEEAIEKKSGKMSTAVVVEDGRSSKVTWLDKHLVGEFLFQLPVIHE